LPANSVGASVFRIVFSVVPYGRNDAPTTGISQETRVGKRVTNRTLKALFVSVCSGTETKSVTCRPGCS
jgi:hypothetical protein